jgi:hypothetical protein
MVISDGEGGVDGNPTFLDPLLQYEEHKMAHF